MRCVGCEEHVDPFDAKCPECGAVVESDMPADVPDYMLHARRQPTISEMILADLEMG